MGYVLRIILNMKMYSNKYLRNLWTFAIEFRSRKSSAVIKEEVEEGEEKTITRHSPSSLSV